MSTGLLETSHSDTPHSVGLLWLSDQPDAETPTWQHTSVTTDRHPWPPAGFKLSIPARERPQTQALDRSATGIGPLNNLWNETGKEGGPEGNDLTICICCPFVFVVICICAFFICCTLCVFVVILCVFVVILCVFVVSYVYLLSSYVYLLSSYVYLLYLMCICCTLCVFVVILCVFVVILCVFVVSYVYCCHLMCICCHLMCICCHLMCIVVILCVFVVSYVYLL